MLNPDQSLPVDVLECAEDYAEALNNAYSNLDGRDLVLFEEEAKRLLREFRNDTAKLALKKWG